MAQVTQAKSFSRLKPYLASGLGIPPERLLDNFKPATLSNLPDVLTLRQTVLGAGLTWDDAQYWRWKYLKQPGASDTNIPYWVFEKGDEIIGGVGLQRVQIDVAGKTASAAWSCDIMVHPDYAGRGVGVLMVILFQEAVPFLLTLGSNAQSTGMFSKLFRRLPSLRCYKKPIRTGPILGHRLKSKPLASACAVVLDPLLALYDRSCHVRIPQGLTFERIEKFDARIDALSAKTGRPTPVRVRRSAEHLNWRFLSHPRHNYECHGVFSAGVLLGYVVTRIGGTGGDLSGKIVDWLCEVPVEAPDLPIHTILFQWAVAHLADQGASTVYTYAYDPAAASALDRLGFVRDTAADSPFFVGSCPREFEAELLDAQNWALTCGDSDID